MKNILLLFLLTISLCSCLKNIDDVELNTNPFDADYAIPLATVEDIRVIDTTLSSGIYQCRVYVDFKVDELTLERVRNITNIETENVNFVLRFKRPAFSFAAIEVINIDLDKIEAGKKYSVEYPVNCGDELCIEFLYEDQVSSISGSIQTNTKASVIQKICFIITP